MQNQVTGCMCPPSHACASCNLKLRFWTYRRGKLPVRVNKNKSTAKNVAIYIPVPNDLNNPLFKTQNGTVSYLPSKEAIQWSLKTFPGQTEIFLRFQFSVPTVRAENSDKSTKKPIEISFEIPSFTVSGINVRYLKITEKSGYQAFPYVKYLTKNGQYQIRMV